MSEEQRDTLISDQRIQKFIFRLLGSNFPLWAQILKKLNPEILSSIEGDLEQLLISAIEKMKGPEVEKWEMLFLERFTHF